ncbi:YqiA/YcfP family alpha/beta fold hydrolase [Pseudoalteromonas byunsanensis]|uniref:Esterase YqiA n=1 Tax=Pseudoalteromonas byunsanensis TaxID=327939 RepID=A0A1S1NAB6_9GAMM|nr:YqiA/YcfP family alpha/beta fold hydrolase [Pseudoalteromonas byunsanensis]OHU95227.1 esterase YqiA [Pseudoalteromonas byunsanensis]
MVKRVIYIHGFNSSELSAKAQQFGLWLKEQAFQCHYITPRLHYDPRVAIVQLEALVDGNTVLMGSSLGGFYATYLSQRHNIPAVVINPAVRPFELLADYLGPQYNPYQQIHYQLGQEHVYALRKLYLQRLTAPSLLMLLQQMGDEVLPYQHALQYYKSCLQRVEFAGDHSFMGFQRYFDTVVNFLKIT